MPVSPLVSALVSVYAAEQFMAGCLEDLTQQTLGERLEIIVIDACSPQNEAAIVAHYRREFPNITFVRAEKREGVYASWNRGIRLAKGRYITNANTDDRHRKDALEVLAAALEARPELDFVYGDCLVGRTINETFEENDGQRRMCFPEYFAPATLLYCQLGPQPLWRKSVHDTVGFFDESFRACGDWMFNIALAGAARGGHIPEALGLYLEHQGAISFRDTTMGQENELVRRRWQHPQAVEQCYKTMGIASETPAGLAAIHLDMGLRALRFYPPWSYGEPEAALPFARRCFRHALRLDPGLSAAKELLSLSDVVLCSLADLPSPLRLPTQAELAGLGAGDGVKEKTSGASGV